MIDYTTLKHQADGTPTWDAFLGIILKVAVESGPRIKSIQVK